MKSKLLLPTKIRDIYFWFKGKLITKKEHDKLSWEDIHESNNRGGK